MSQTSQAEALLRAGDPAGALSALQTQVRNQAADPKLRVFLFQLLCVLGQWERALNQLKLCADMDAAAIPMREMYGTAINCELLRAEVFAGRKTPMLFGEPQPWLALLIESLLRAGAGDTQAAAKLRAQAFDEAPATAGKVDGRTFSWIADADMRLGPVLEAFVNGRYYWVPFSRLAQIAMEEPEDLRDFVWQPANLKFANGGEVLAMLPARYPESEGSPDGLVVLSRKTIWDEAGGVYRGLGQRVLATDDGEYPLLQVRNISLEGTPDSA